MSDHCCSAKGAELERLARQADQRRVLVGGMVINAGMFFAEFGAGLIAGSAALMADATDMLADAFVFGLSLYAVARSDRWKAGVAAFKGALDPDPRAGNPGQRRGQDSERGAAQLEPDARSSAERRWSRT